MSKVLISSLGAGKEDGKYRKTSYKIGEKVYKNLEYISVVLEEHFKIDKVFYIGTFGSMWENLYEYYCKKFNKEKNEEYKKYLINQMTEFIVSDINSKRNFKSDFIDFSEFYSKFENKVIPIITNYGLSDGEIFENFNHILKIVDELEDGDELYLDITHSFRSNAFWIFLVMNYINDVVNKNIEIKYISYGMFEASENGITPVIDLNSFLKLMKWIKGAYTFKNFGNSDLICELLMEKNDKNNESIKNKLENFSNAININYISSIKQNIITLKNNFELLKNIDGPAKLIIPNVVSEFLEHFDNIETDYDMFLKLAEWHFKEKRYSLAFTNIQEGFISYAKYNFDLLDKEDNEELNNNIKGEIIKLKNNYFNIKDRERKQNFQIIKKFLSTEKEKNIKNFFNNYELCRKIRNNIAHSGEERNNYKADINSLEKILKETNELFKNRTLLKEYKEKLELYRYSR